MSFYLAKLIIAGVGLGLAAGISLYTFWYAKGYSYLSNDPGSCANCHIMEEQYSGWLKSSHRSVATCNDCHTPQNFANKYFTKAWNGFWHSYYFTANNFHEPIMITERNRQIAEQSCRHCHQPVVDAIVSGKDTLHPSDMSCIRCHSSVGHPHLGD
jgi:cytochrome c nitrite reductase small subunit